MAKKKILGRTKLSEKAPGETGQKSQPVGMIKKVDKIKPTSFRLKESDTEDLKEIVNDVNELFGSPVSETKIVRALIKIGKRIKKEKIAKAVRELP